MYTWVGWALGAVSGRHDGADGRGKSMRGTPPCWPTRDQEAQDDPRALQSGSVRHRTKNLKKKNTYTQFLVAFFSRIFRTIRPDTQTICSRSKRSPESGLHRGGGQQNEMARNGGKTERSERVIYISRIGAARGLYVQSVVGLYLYSSSSLFSFFFRSALLLWHLIRIRV